MPALTIDAETLQSGLASIFEAMQQVLEYPSSSESDTDTDTLRFTNEVSHVD